MWSYRIYGNGGGGGGAGGADLTKVGTPVTVEAHNSFKKGDEFYGVKKKGVTSEILGTNFTVGGGHTIYALSEDHTVAILNQTITRTSTIYNVGIFNEETNAFDVIEIPLPNLNSMMESISNRGLINEDGSLIIINNVKNRSYTYDAVIVIEINKTNKTGTAKYIDKLDIGTAVLDDTVQAVTLHTSSQKAQSCSRLTKNYYIGESIVYKSSGSNTSSNLRNAVYILRYENGTFTKALWSKVEKDSTFDSICGSTWTDENTLLVSAMMLSTSNVFLRKFVFDGDSVTYSENTTEFKDIRLSKNGKYIGCYTSPNYYVYQVNATDLTISKLYEGSSSGNCYPDDTGDYALINTDIINLKDKSILKSNVTMISRFFNIVNDKFVAGNYFWQLYLNDVEYVIYNSVEKLDDKDGICGIVPNDMTIGETGTAQKISNIENDLFDAGIPVTVEARNSFTKGDKFYGVKSEDAKDEILKTNTTVASGMGIVELSADNTVAVLNQTIGTQTKKYIVGVFNEKLNCFDSVEIDLPDMSSIQASVSGRGHVNEDGSLIIVDGFKNSKGYYEGVLVVELDKVNKTGTAKYFEDISINNYYYSGYKTTVELRSGSQVNTIFTCVIGNYYIGYSKKLYYTYTKEDGTTVASTKSFAYRYIVQYKDGQFTDPLWQLIGGGSAGYYDILEDIYTYSWYDEKSFIIMFKFYFSASSSPTRLYKFTISNDKLTSTYIENNNLKTGHFSKNGKFIGCNPSNSIIYSFNGSDMTLTEVFNSSTIKGACYPDDTGDYALINNGIIKLDDSTTLASNLAPKSRFFNIVNDKYLSGSNFVTLSNTTGEADYVAYSTLNDIENKTGIYGIVANDMEIGEIGNAQRLYDIEKFVPNLQNKSVIPSSEEQVITADEGYDGLNTVTINKVEEPFIIPSGELNITENGTYDITQYASINIDIPTITLSKIELTQVGKTEYIADDIFDFSEYKVLATYSNTTSRDVTDMCTFTPNGELTTSDSTVVISYTENGITKTVEQFILVNERVYEYEDFSSSITPTSWTAVKNGTDYKATNNYGEWTISASSYQNGYYYANNAMDGSDSSEWDPKTDDTNKYYMITCPVEIKPTNFSCIHIGTSADSYVEALNANTKEWETIGNLKAVSGSGYATTTTLSFGDSYYKAFRINLIPYGSTDGTGGVRLFEVKITAGTIRK